MSMRTHARTHARKHARMHTRTHALSARTHAHTHLLTRRLAEIAEAEGHHPDLHLTGYNTAVAELTTHAAGGLTENDFIVAAKVRAWVQRMGGGGARWALERV